MHLSSWPLKPGNLRWLLVSVAKIKVPDEDISFNLEDTSELE